MEEGVGCGGVDGEGLGEEGFGFGVFGTVHFDSGSFYEEFGLVWYGMGVGRDG